MVRNQREGFSRREGVSCARSNDADSEVTRKLAASDAIWADFWDLEFNRVLSKEDEEISKSALSTVRAEEEEIEMKKMGVKEKVQAQLGQIEEETKHFPTIREHVHWVPTAHLRRSIKLDT